MSCSDEYRLLKSVSVLWAGGGGGGHNLAVNKSKIQLGGRLETLFARWASSLCQNFFKR